MPTTACHSSFRLSPEPRKPFLVLMIVIARRARLDSLLRQNDGGEPAGPLSQFLTTVWVS